MEVSLHNTQYPDGTQVHAYDATGYSSGFPGANPPGEPVETVEASNYSVTFTLVEHGVPYFAAGEVGGEWRYIKFIPDELTPDALQAAIDAEVQAREAADAAIVAARGANGKGFVAHGEDAEKARPSGFASIEWEGTVEPDNIADGDTWIDVS